MTRMTRSLCLLITLLWGASLACGQAPEGRYRLVDSLRLGGQTGWDYLTVDTSADRLYISRGGHVQIVDLSKKVTGDVQNTPGVHGVALVHPLGRGYTSNGRDSSVTVFDLATLAVITTIRIDARNPDAILYEPVSRRVFTFNGGSANATAIETANNTLAGNIGLGGRPEFAIADGTGKIFVNIIDKHELVVLDARRLEVVHRWSLEPGEEPSGLAYDREHRLLFSGCRNKLMVIMNAENGRVVATVPIGQGVDGTAYDPGARLAFCANGDGTLTVVREESPEKFSLVENVPTPRGARTLALDERTHRIYTVSAKFGPPPAPTAERPRPRPSIEPGSVTLYILAP